MKIIIAGAGEVGYHIAKLLSHENLDIVVVDMDKEKLSKIENSLDVLTYRGDTTSFSVLEEIHVDKADMFIAVTDLQNTNIIACLIAKKAGARKVFARVTNPEYLERKNSIALQRAGIDMLISPEELAANEIFNLVEESVFNEMHSFGNGALNMFGIMLDKRANIINKTVKQVADRFKEHINFIPVCITRQKYNNEFEYIVPREDTVYKEGDHVYFIGIEGVRRTLYSLMGKQKTDLSDVLILGGGRVGKKTAKLLKAHGHDVKIIERSLNKAEDLIEDNELSDILVINGDGRDNDLLEEEGISESDAFVAVTGRSETNIMACLQAKYKGVKKTYALVENTEYINLSHDIGIDGFINKKLMAANAIFKYIRKGKVLDVMNLHDLKAEVLEYRVEENSRIAHTKIEDLKFPREAIVGGIIRKFKGYLPTKDFEIQPNDRVVVFSHLECIKKIESYFQ
ncbi:Trk system potassium transporter TrkA [Weeksellaceae bacterium TAE3-ERU29]|nr:Trk system potassium transporter TrkA [Weeksellaceae bacterium TAE3-ERU29]